MHLPRLHRPRHQRRRRPARCRPTERPVDSGWLFTSCAHPSSGSSTQSRRPIAISIATASRCGPPPMAAPAARASANALRQSRRRLTGLRASHCRSLALPRITTSTARPPRSSPASARSTTRHANRPTRHHKHSPPGAPAAALALTTACISIPYLGCMDPPPPLHRNGQQPDIDELSDTPLPPTPTKYSRSGSTAAFGPPPSRTSQAPHGHRRSSKVGPGEYIRSCESESALISSSPASLQPRARPSRRSMWATVSLSVATALAPSATTAQPPLETPPATGWSAC